MNDTPTYEPVMHYASGWRPDYTACGRPKAYVMATFFAEKVTCGACIQELELEGDEGVAR